MRSLVPFVFLLAALPSYAQSDLEVKDAVLARFTKSKGASLLGQSIHWHVPSKVFHLPRKSRNGFDLFVSQGIGVLAGSGSNAVEEVRRRGGDACIRGRVVRVPEKERAPGDPAYAVVVESLSRRKH
jgi:hypothetical protein